VSRKDRFKGSRPDPATAERVTSIIEAAERAASALIDSADANAKQYLREAEAEADRIVAARLAELIETADSLVEQAAAIRRESERLLAALRGSGARVERAGAGEGGSAFEPEQPPFPHGKHLAAVPSDEAAPGAAEEGEEAPDGEAMPARLGSASGARLLATQMAVSGSSREEIEARLRSGFEIEDTASILDAILGPED
jgi:vacuolar-type H+-ATPase subunit H